MAATLTSCSNCKTACNKHIADLALIASRFSQALLQENFTSKWWFWSRVQARNITKNKLLKLVNWTKMDFLFAVLSLNWIIQKKAPKMDVLLMILWKQGVLHVQVLRLGCYFPQSNLNFWLHAWIRPCSNIQYFQSLLGNRHLVFWCKWYTIFCDQLPTTLQV